jgi:hypothetical protein
MVLKSKIACLELTARSKGFESPESVTEVEEPQKLVKPLSPCGKHGKLT